MLLKLIFSMLLATTDCDYKVEMHYMVLPNSKHPNYEVYHHYNSSRFLYLTNHNDLVPDSLYHQYEFYYPSFTTIDSVNSLYCVIDSIWEEVYYPNETEHPYYEN